MSSVLLGGVPARGASAATPPSEPGTPPAPGAVQRGNAVTVIAGVGVLLLAMGVGVLIGRSGAAKAPTSSPSVISVATAPGGAASGTGTAAAPAFTDDWPAGTSGFTVQLQTLPSATPVSAVEAAKTAAGAKGAKGVGALKSEDFSSLPSGSYVIYSGVYHNRAQAQKGLAGLKRSFAGAKVVAVSNAGAAAGAGGSGSEGSGAGASQSHPAPPSVLKNLRKSGGGSYEQKSKNLPNVIETG